MTGRWYRRSVGPLMLRWQRRPWHWRPIWKREHGVWTIQAGPGLVTAYNRRRRFGR